MSTPATTAAAETQHTPGPLFVKRGLENALTQGHVITTADRRQIVAECPRIADATLYAAAPDLLRAAQIALEQINRTFSIVQLTPSLDDGLATAKDELIEAINKALGD